MIIHISGSYGSGKSTLGYKLKNRFKNKIMVIELDNLLFDRKHGVSDREFKKIIRAKTKAGMHREWKRIVKHALIRFINKNKNKIIVFVGILQIVTFINTMLVVDRVEIDEADYKFFIDISDQQLIYRYYDRLCYDIVNISPKEFKSYFTRIVTGIQIIFGSREIIKIHHSNNIYYKKNHYIIKMNDDIEKQAGKLITEHLALSKNKKRKKSSIYIKSKLNKKIKKI